MSRDDGRRDRDDEDPFAFAPDDGDGPPPPGAGNRSSGAPSPPGDGPPTAGDGGRADAEEDPFAFAPDAHDAPASGPDRRGTDAEGPADEDPAAAARRRSAARIVAEAEEARVERAREAAVQAADNARSVGVRWLAVAGIVFVLIVGITTITGGRDAQGGDVEPGETLPAFAAPLVSQPRLENEDVNLATKADQGEAGSRPACSIRDRSVVTSCALLARGPLVVVLFSRGIDDCVRAVDRLEVERRRFPQVQTLAVSLLGRHDSTGTTARERGWTLPVVYDRDGALASVLGAPACPLVLFVRRDGTVQQRIIGSLDDGALVRGMQALIAPPAGAGRTVDAAPPGR